MQCLDKFLEESLKDFPEPSKQSSYSNRIHKGIPLQELQAVFLKEFLDGFLNESVDEVLKYFLEIIVKEFLDDSLKNFLALAGKLS